MPSEQSVIDHSRFEITGYELLRPEPDHAGAPCTLRIHVMNRGGAPGSKPTLKWRLEAAQTPFSERRIDVEFEDVLYDAITTPPAAKTGSRIAENDGFVYDLTARSFDKRAFSYVMNGKLTLYLMVVLIWSDDSLPDGWWWVTEFSTWQRGDSLPFHLCKNHNTTYKKYIEGSE